MDQILCDYGVLHTTTLLIKKAFGSACETEKKWNQIRRGNDNGNYYFVKLFGLNGK